MCGVLEHRLESVSGQKISRAPNQIRKLNEGIIFTKRDVIIPVFGYGCDFVKFGATAIRIALALAFCGCDFFGVGCPDIPRISRTIEASTSRHWSSPRVDIRHLLYR
jgi:hypothetical protein